jgi:N-acetylmuramoyl-L-alanine amidase
LASFLVVRGRKAVGEIRYFGDGYEALTSYHLSNGPAGPPNRGRQEKMFGANVSRKSAASSNLGRDRMAFKICCKASAKVANRISAHLALWIAPWPLILAAALAPVSQARAEDLPPADASAASPRPLEAVRAEAGGFDDNGDKARLIFELSVPVDAAAFVLADPDRVIVDAPQIEFMIDPEIGRAPTPPPHGSRRNAAKAKSLVKPEGLVASFRFGQLMKGRSRIVVDLSKPARIVRVVCEKSEEGAKPRLVIELARIDRARFAEAAQTARAALAEPAQARISENIQSDGGKPIVMIDPGHGGIDRGAVVNGLVEKDLVLDFAKALAARLDADGRFQPVLTRDDDSFVSLDERVRMARDRKVALFVSIHADTLAEAADVSGATIYTVSDRASDAEAARLAEKENQADAAAGLDRSENASEVSDILFELTRRETRAYSHAFAHTLLNYWRVAGRLNKNPRRSAGFRVLKAPDVPSVLLELGYLSNEKDDIALLSPQWRDKAVTKMTEAIAAFFSERGKAADFTNADTGPARTLPAKSLRPGGDTPKSDPSTSKTALQGAPAEPAGIAR